MYDFFSHASLGDVEAAAPQPTHTYEGADLFAGWTEGPGQSSNWMEGPGQTSQQYVSGFEAYSGWQGGLNPFSQMQLPPHSSQPSQSAGELVNSYLNLGYNPFGDDYTQVYLHNLLETLLGIICNTNASYLNELTKWFIGARANTSSTIPRCTPTIHSFA
jgi:hypothetical protein